MAYFIKESDQDNADLIHDFNKDLEDHRISFRLPVPINGHSRKDGFIYERSFILTENKTVVRAGYSLKCQWFKINDTLLQIGNYNRPISAGLFNKKYNICGVLLVNDAQKRYPNIFSLGMGGTSEALPKIIKRPELEPSKSTIFFQNMSSGCLSQEY